MKASWLHVSDFHFRGGDPYDRDVVLRALVKSIRTYRDGGRRPDLVFATGDIAHSGQENEYEAAAEFLDALIEAAGVERRHLFVIPGNHDVDREQGVGLARTLASREEADRYFKPGSPKVHIAQKQRAFARWYNRYFEGVRTLPEDSTCGPVETVEVGGLKIGILPVNSALFCQDDHDHNALWVGRRCLDNALEKLRGLGTSLNIALVHHPLDWLSDIESSNIRGALSKRIDFVLRGHLHETDVERVAGVSGETLNFAAGAAYQTRKWPNRALYAEIDGDRVTVFPIRYEDDPEEIWTVDPSLFPQRGELFKDVPNSTPYRPSGQAIQQGSRTAGRALTTASLSEQHPVATQPPFRRARRSAREDWRWSRRSVEGERDRSAWRPRGGQERTGAGVRTTSA